MKIARIELNDFEAFPAPEVFDLGDGQNLLLFGENGAGKSSFFRAVREFFNLRTGQPYEKHRNIFKDPPGTAGYMKVHFTDGQAPAEWLYGKQRPSKDDRLVQGSLRLGCLDYRALLETNYVFRDGAINLFDVLVQGVLSPWLVDVVDLKNPRKARLGQLWKETLEKSIPRPRQRRPYRVTEATEAAQVISATLKAHLPKIEQRAMSLLRRLRVENLEFELSHPTVKLDGENRNFIGQKIGLSVRLNGTAITLPQMFLNEARLTAIALSLYFASLLETVPDDPQWPRVLVLDDVLIGLDMNNRLPVLDILRSEFKNWQVLLLTHDRMWFDLAQIETAVDDHWVAYEMHARRTQEGVKVFDAPWVRPPATKPKELHTIADDHIARARGFLGKDDRTAAFHARVAFEAKLKAFCHSNAVNVPFMLDDRRLDTDDFLNAIEAFLQSKGTRPLALFHIDRVRLFRRGVLNPYSHYFPVTVAPCEVQMAIRAVEELSLHATAKDFAQQVGHLLLKPSPTAEEILDTACWLRTAFEADLRDFLCTQLGRVRFRHNWAGLNLVELWDAAKERMNAVNGALAPGFITDIETHRRVFLDEWTFAAVSILTKPDLDAAWTALRDPGSSVGSPQTRLATFS